MFDWIIQYLNSYKWYKKVVVILWLIFMIPAFPYITCSENASNKYSKYNLAILFIYTSIIWISWILCIYFII